MEITVYCHEAGCHEKFTSDRISVAMENRRIHIEERHLDAPVETDTSGR